LAEELLGGVAPAAPPPLAPPLTVPGRLRRPLFGRPPLLRSAPHPVGLPVPVIRDRDSADTASALTARWRGIRLTPPPDRRSAFGSAPPQRQRGDCTLRGIWTERLAPERSAGAPACAPQPNAADPPPLAITPSRCHHTETALRPNSERLSGHGAGIWKRQGGGGRLGLRCSAVPAVAWLWQFAKCKFAKCKREPRTLAAQRAGVWHETCMY